MAWSLHRIHFTPEAESHLAALRARERSALLDAIGRTLSYEPTVASRNRKPMDPDRRLYVAPWELRVGRLRVYYAVSEAPEPVVVVVAIGVKERERIRIGGKDLEP